MGENTNDTGYSPLQQKLHEIIFEAETPAGKLFDVLLLWAILLSVVAVMLESVTSFREAHGVLLNRIEWVFTVIFTLEYVLRVYSVRKSRHYTLSFYGIIDLIAVVPTYLSLFFTGSQYLLVFRVVRLLRVFRVLKLVRYVGEATVLSSALQASRHKIAVFLGGVLALNVIVGTLMYLIEGEQHGFTSIPRSMYWAIVTLTTVGYGDIAPQTILGQTLAAILMILGYGIIAVPTGIVSVELSKAQLDSPDTHSCSDCGGGPHAIDAKFCKFCGAKLRPRRV